MPIHDQSYRRYRGPRLPHGRAWWVIARAALVERLRRRMFLALLLLAWTPFVIRGAQMYLAASFPQASFLAPSAQLFREFLAQQGIFVFLVAVFAGAGLVADDRRANALQLYLSKPLTRVDYVVGKLVVLLALLAAITWLPAMLLLALQAFMAGETAFLRTNLFLVPAITLYSALLMLLSALGMLALSSLSRSRRFVGMLYAGIAFFTTAVQQALRNITGSRGWAWISPSETLGVIGDAIFRMSVTPAIPVPLAIVVIAIVLGACLFVLERRIRPVEIV